LKLLGTYRGVVVLISATIQEYWKQDFDSRKLTKLKRLEKLRDQVPNLRNTKKLEKN